jgi:hypothetical protein
MVTTTRGAGEGKRGRPAWAGDSLRREALAGARVALGRARALAGALQSLVDAQESGDEGEMARLAGDLHARRRAFEPALLDALELADRVVDVMGAEVPRHRTR